MWFLIIRVAIGLATHAPLLPTASQPASHHNSAKFGNSPIMASGG
jgi:hypothetical protein